MHVRRLVLYLLLLAVNARAVDDAVERAAMLAAVEADVRASADVLGRASLSGPVRDALLAVPRHRFVPVDLRRFAYDNRPLPIGHGQTISQPTIVAMMTDLLGVAPGDTVLERTAAGGATSRRLLAVRFVPLVREDQ